MDEALEPGRHDVVLHGARIAYHVYGEGPLLVALPGGPGFSHSYLRSEHLERQAKVVYVDPVGTGDSEELDDPSQYGRARDVSDLEALADHLGLSRVSLLGHSYGGFVAQTYALDHPERVERLVLYDTSPTNGADFDASLGAQMQARSTRPWFAAASSALEALFSRELTDAQARELSATVWPLYAFDHERDPSLAARLTETARFSLRRSQKAPRAPFDVRDRLRSLRVPALVVVGAADFICATVLARMLHEAIAGSTLVQMERSGHMAHLEEPERFAQTVAAFLRGAP